MFADDTTLFAANRAQLISMIQDVKAALTEHGLKLNLDKCVVQTNRIGVRIAPLSIDWQSLPMVDATIGFKVLGTQYTLLGRCSAEIRSLVSAAWASFTHFGDFLENEMET